MAKRETISRVGHPGAVARGLQAHEPVADPGQRREQHAVGHAQAGELPGVGEGGAGRRRQRCHQDRRARPGSLDVDTSRLAPLPAASSPALRALLAALAPPLLDAGMTKATPRDDGVEVVLAHATEIAFSAWAQAARDAIVVGCAALHEDDDRRGRWRSRSSPQLLRGERAVPGYDGAVLRPSFFP